MWWRRGLNQIGFKVVLCSIMLMFTSLLSCGDQRSWLSQGTSKSNSATTQDSKTPPLSASNSAVSESIVHIEGGGGHSIAITNNGNIWVWGYNFWGQLGTGDTQNRPSPVKVSGFSNVTAVSGRYHTLAVTKEGTVWAWGDNEFGKLGDGISNGPSIPARTSPGQVLGLADIIAVAAGGTHSVALKKDGTLWAWGHNYYGELGDGTTISNHSPVSVTNLDSVVAIAVGEAHTIALKSDGTVWTWGEGSIGALGHGDTEGRVFPAQVFELTNITAISTKSRMSAALKGDGTVWWWGASAGRSPAQISGLTDVKAIAAGFYHLAALKNDGTVWVLEDRTISLSSTPVQVEGLTDVAAIASGDTHTMALKNDGTVWAWGMNDEEGMLGIGISEMGSYRNTPTQVFFNNGE